MMYLNEPSTAAAATEPAIDRHRMLLLSPQGGLLTEGLQARLAAPAARLGHAVAQHFATDGAGPHLVGALPFDHEAEAHLLAPRHVHDAAAATAWMQATAAQAAAPPKPSTASAPGSPRLMAERNACCTIQRRSGVAPTSQAGSVPAGTGSGST